MTLSTPTPAHHSTTSPHTPTRRLLELLVACWLMVLYAPLALTAAL